MLGLWLLLVTGVQAQTSGNAQTGALGVETGPTVEQTASVYYAYPAVPTVMEYTPSDFEAVYVSHYGRHGSRWMPDSLRYTRLLRYLQKARTEGALTPLGLDVVGRAERVWADAHGNEGLLSPLGHRQHAAIARRMARRLPGFFRARDSVVARSSTVQRCQQSMGAFVESLRDTLPGLHVSMEASPATMAVIVPPKGKAAPLLSDTARWVRELWSQTAQKADATRLLGTLFVNPDTIGPKFEVAGELYWYASVMQDVEPDITFYDLFTLPELQTIWEAQNTKMYIQCGRSPENQGLPQATAVATLTDIISRADSALEKGDVRADLRFGHDTNLLRLLSLMGVEEASGEASSRGEISKVWRDYELSPMGANLQMVFYRDRRGEVFVKLYLNERPAHLPVSTPLAPFYPWDNVKRYVKVLFQKVPTI